MLFVSHELVPSLATTVKSSACWESCQWFHLFDIISLFFWIVHNRYDDSFLLDLSSVEKRTSRRVLKLFSCVVCQPCIVEHNYA